MRITLKLALFTVIAVIVLIGTVSLFDYGNEGPMPTPDVGAERDLVESPAPIVPEVAVPVVVEDSGELNEIQMFEQERWKASRGFMAEESRYLRRLSRDQLDILIDQGNSRAIRIRASRMLKDPENMFRLYEEAIVLGDVPALLSAASVWHTHGVRSGNELFAVNEDPFVNLLAMVLTARLRGDNVLATDWQDRLLAGVELTEAQVSASCSAAHVILNRLELERTRRGLPPFDNTPSPHGQDWRDTGPIGSTCDQA